jgi:3-phenylpropionate/trans-cinnamate dioxygenase ferredoxin subunit
MPALREEPHGDGVDTEGLPVTHGSPVEADGDRLIDVAALGTTGVAEVRTADHGVLAVGLADGTPFAVSNVCRHQFAKLGQGRVTEDGCLECPWHRARYDVRTGRMTEGPKGRIFGFKPYSAAVRAFASGVAPLHAHAVTVRDGAIWLA